MPGIHSPEALREHFCLTPSEKAWREDASGVPLGITEHYLSLIDGSDPADPLRRQVVPTAGENITLNYEESDPQAEEGHSVTPRLVHRYTNRAAFLVTDICPMYCRHCFRRRFTGNLAGPASPDEIAKAADYVGSHPEIREVLFTGGDPLTLGNSALQSVFGAFRSRRADLIIRLCTRYPVSDPDRIDDDLCAMVASFSSAPVFVLTQFNHPRELCPQSRRALDRLHRFGLQVFNQTVLLRGVNDDSAVLAELFENLLGCYVKPYYLFQCDLVAGTGTFRVPLCRGMEIYRELSTRVSGLALPVYAIDLPGGRGKVNLGTAVISPAGGGFVDILTPEGARVRYPDK